MHRKTHIIDYEYTTYHKQSLKSEQPVTKE